jgi:hypothetical protein
MTFLSTFLGRQTILISILQTGLNLKIRLGAYLGANLSPGLNLIKLLGAYLGA